jgi:hypothetical protein
MRDSTRNALLFQYFRRGDFMSDTKRLDIQFGSFACSVQGFDDPVQPVQQVLQALQSLLEETPELADADISFDANAIERLIGEVARRADIAEENVEIVPGLIIVHRSGAETAISASQSVDSAGEVEGKAWSPPLVSGNAIDTGIPDENGPPEAADNSDSGYLNIFSTGARTDSGPGAGSDSQASHKGGSGEDTRADPLAAFAIDPEEPGEGNGTFQNDSFSARLARATAEETDTPGSDPFASSEETLDEAPARNVFADQTAADFDPLTTDEDTMIDFFSAADDADKNTDAEPTGADNMFAATELDVTEPVTLLKASDLAAPGDTPADAYNGGEDASVAENSDRVAALFGASDDQPEVEEVDEGYTAAGLAKTAEAKTVPELMVSAAAWMVLIQGQTTFSRKDVIEVFSTIPGDHSKTLEAKIKGFGKAVRNSQLVMIEDGLFGISRAELERYQMLL